MKISQVEMQADGRKATFFYIADGRVDFRELIKVYASEFKVKVEMRQIGARQEAGKVGGIGSYLVYRFLIGEYNSCPLPEFIHQPDKTKRTMWPFKMLFEL